MNILLVDDEPLELEQLKWLLHHRYPQWKYYTAIDAIQALKISNETDIQLSFIDIHLPGHSGFELMKEFRSQNKEIGMIIVSAYQKFDYAKESLRLGVFDYIVKPIIEEELYQTVDQYLHNHPEKKTIHLL
ncbi:response regulator [Tepidibacillus infernus]|uniref:response regulator n=1 Tax=Tepidibacillus TaxID=1494427 RepID=UPI000A50FBA6|nr:response regulator [Tepidibacillus decaturensis]